MTDTENYRESYRPQFHFSPPKFWINDPNGLVFFEGEYHLFYQHNPVANTWGHMSWGHAVSSDLLHWLHLPIALPEEDDMMIFSGCVVVDKENSSGFSEDGKAILVAIYTGHNTLNGRQTQCLACSADRGRNWIKYTKNPVLDIASTSFRDPKVFWHKESARWIMVVALSDERKVQFYNSSNLKEWNLLSEFGPAGAVNGVWECPDLLPLAVNGDASFQKWLLKVDLAQGAQYGGSGGQYFIGDFDGSHFTMQPDKQTKIESTKWIDHGKDFYAAASFSNIADKRCIWMGWLSNWQYAEKIPTHPWKNILSVPRELELQLINGKILLTQHPLRELKKLRLNGQSLNNIKLKNKKSPFPQGYDQAVSLELKAEFVWNDMDVNEFGFEFFSVRNRKITVGYNCRDKKAFINREESHTHGFHSEFPGEHSAILPQTEKTISFHIFLDSCSVEVFVNNGEKAFTDLIFPENKNFIHQFYMDGKQIMLKSFKIWHLKSIWDR